MYNRLLNSVKTCESIKRKRHLKFFLLPGIIALILINSCFYNNEEDLFGPRNENCPDSTIFTFSGGVQPILSQHCLSCHSNANSVSLGGGNRLQDYADVKSKATVGSLLGTITHSPGYPQMPQDSRKLADCNILIIRKWIEAGALNN